VLNEQKMERLWLGIKIITWYIKFLELVLVVSFINVIKTINYFTNISSTHVNNRPI